MDKNYPGVQSFLEMGVVCCVLIAEVQFAAIPPVCLGQFFIVKIIKERPE